MLAVGQTGAWMAHELTHSNRQSTAKWYDHNGTNRKMCHNIRANGLPVVRWPWLPAEYKRISMRTNMPCMRTEMVMLWRAVVLLDNSCTNHHFYDDCLACNMQWMELPCTGRPNHNKNNTRTMLRPYKGSIWMFFDFSSILPPCQLDAFALTSRRRVALHWILFTLQRTNLRIR